MSWMEAQDGNIVMFHPEVNEESFDDVKQVLASRWIGQGPKVLEFETAFEEKFSSSRAVSVNSGTAALHLAYLLAGVGPGDEVLCPLFTCTATNIPLLYIGATPVFVDVNPKTLNIDTLDLRRRITSRTKAIVTVDFAGLPCDYTEIVKLGQDYGIPVIQDAAHSLGGSYKGKPVGSIADFTVFSFQAIKHLTTGDGGMLTIRNKELLGKARRLRWFGIDREKKSGGIWENDITEIGFKYHMNDIEAAIGLANLRNFDSILRYRQSIFEAYLDSLVESDQLKVLGATSADRQHAAWMLTILVDRRQSLVEKLRRFNIEASQVHYRNDKYSIFKKYAEVNYQGMDSVENNYLCLPIHTKMKISDVEKICKVINSGW